MNYKEPPAGYMNTANIAKVLNITTRRVQQLTKEGIIKKEKTVAGDYYNLGTTLGMYLQNLRETIAEREKKTSKEETIEEKKLTAETRAKRAMAGKIELSLDDVKKGSHNSDYVKAATTDLILVIAEKLGKIQKELTQSLIEVKEATAASVVIEKIVYKVLDELGDYQYSEKEANERRKKHAHNIEQYIKE